MKAEIKTTTEMQTMTVEIPVTTERVHLDVSIQEAHFLHSLLGNSPFGIAQEFGVSSDAFWAMWDAIHEALGDPDCLYLSITRGDR